MNSLISPVEALAFDYVSFGIYDLVNNRFLLPLIAVVTAAVSFWKFRAVAGIIPIPEEKLVVDDTNSSPQPSVAQFQEEVVEKSMFCSSPPPKAAELAAETVIDTVDGCNGVTRGRKFVLYYEDEGEKMAEEVEEEEGSEVRGGGGREEEWWERVLKMRTGEMEWYRFQDMRRINGNVVRLWEEVRCPKQSSDMVY